MPLIPWSRSYNPRIDAFVLVATAPFLLFPTVLVAPTILALLFIGIRWLVWGSAGQTSPLSVPVFLLSVTIMVGALVTSSPPLTLPKLTGLLFGVSLWHWSSMLRNRITSVWMTRGLIAAGAGVSVLGALLLQWPRKAGFLLPIVSLVQRIQQLLGLDQFPVLMHANALAGTLLLFIPLAIALSFDQRRQAIERWPMGIVAGSGLFLMLLTQSRAGWIGMMVAMVCLGFGFWAKGKLRASSPTLLLLIIPMLLLAYGATLFNPAAPTPDNQITSTDTLAFRMDVWRWSVDAVTDFPFTGIGLGTFREVMPSLYPLEQRNNPDVLPHAHNLFLQIALDVGIPGLIAYLAIIAIVATLLWQQWRWASQPTFALGGLATLLGFHVYGLGDTIALGSKTTFLFWLLIGLIMLVDGEID